MLPLLHQHLWQPVALPMVPAVNAGDSEAWELFPKQGCTLATTLLLLLLILSAGQLSPLASWIRINCFHLSPSRTEELWIQMKCVWDHTWDLSRSGFRQLWAAAASATAAGFCCFPTLSAAWGWVAPSKPSHHHLPVDRPARTQFLWYNSPGDATVWNSLVLLLLLHCVVYASTFSTSYFFFFFRSVTDPWSLSQPHNSR